MIPRLSQGLADLAGKLATAIAPETTSRFAMANTGMISMLLMALAQDAERAVDSRIIDIDEMKDLFAAAGDEAGSLEERRARAGFCARQPASLRLGDVDALHADGLTLLIGLHAWAEQHDDDLDHRIWDFLLNHTERHRLDVTGP
jgi:GAF domain-containing protein